MRNYTKLQYLHPNNKLGKYLKIQNRDKFIKEFVDYIGFYGSWKKTDWFYLFASDNGQSAYVDKIQIRSEGRNRSGWFLAYGLVSYMEHTVDLFRIMERTLQGKSVLKIDFYGKGLLVVNRENMWSSVEKVFTKFFGMQDICITRADYTCDCAKYNFRKINTLNCRIAWKIEKNDKLQYIVFGRKWKSARVLRYYDKRQELIERWTAWLYPEYFGYDQIMRYELQVNSEWFDKGEREITIYDLKNFANFGLYISDNTQSHKKKKVNSDYEEAEKLIRKMFRNKNSVGLQKIRLLLGVLDSNSRLV